MQNDALEYAIAGSLLSDKENNIDTLLKVKPDMFANREIRVLVESIVESFAQHNVINVNLVWNCLISSDKASADMRTLIESTISRSLSADSIKQCLSVLIENYTKRVLYNAYYESAKKIQNGGDSAVVIADLDKTMAELTDLSLSSNVISTQDDAYKQRMKIFYEREKLIRLRPAGHRYLNALLPEGFPKKKMSIIAGRPGMGKSTVRMCFRNDFLSRGFSVCEVCTEPTHEDEVDRTDANLLHIKYKDIVNSRNWDQHDERRIRIANKQIEMKQLGINHHYLFSKNLSIAQMRLELIKIKRKHGLDIVFLDLFDKLKDVNVKKNKPQVVAAALGELSALEEELNVHMSVLAQIGRGAVKGKDKRPTLEDLKDSGAYEEVARIVLLLYREKYYAGDAVQQDIIEVNVAKQNNGPMGKSIIAKYEFLPDYYRIEPMSPDVESLPQ